MDKEIEEIVKRNCNKEGIAKHCPERIAEAIADAGYGNIEQAVKKKFSKRISELKHGEKECLEVGDGEIAARCKVAYSVIENVLNGFDELIKERFGKEG